MVILMLFPHHALPLVHQHVRIQMPQIDCATKFVQLAVVNAKQVSFYPRLEDSVLSQKFVQVLIEFIILQNLIRYAVFIVN